MALVLSLYHVSKESHRILKLKKSLFVPWLGCRQIMHYCAYLYYIVVWNIQWWQNIVVWNIVTIFIKHFEPFPFSHEVCFSRHFAILPAIKVILWSSFSFATIFHAGVSNSVDIEDGYETSNKRGREVRYNIKYMLWRIFSWWNQHVVVRSGIWPSGFNSRAIYCCC